MTNYRADYLTSEALSSMPFKSLGHDVMIHERVTLVGIENISIGSHVRIDPEVILLATGPLTIGCYTHIAAGVFIGAKAGFEMKNFANIAHGARIYTVNDDYSGEHLMGPTIPAELLSLGPGAVLMQEHANKGAGAIVLPGVMLAEGSVLGALSLIGRSTEPWTIYGGVPAKPTKERRRRERRAQQQAVGQTGSARGVGSDLTVRALPKSQACAPAFSSPRLVSLSLPASRTNFANRNQKAD